MRLAQRPQRAARIQHAFTVACLLFLAITAQAQTLTVLHSFSGHADGGSPYAGITFDQQGRIYGTTTYGGSHGDGVVYRLERQGEGWSFSPIYTFGSSRVDGINPLAGVVFGPDGLLYGTTSEGGTEGYGTVFSLQPPAAACKAALCPWAETVIYNFTFDPIGVDPGYGDLVFDQAGNIYGTAFNSSAGGGSVFKLTRSGSGWTASLLWHFTGGNDGSYPASGVIFDNAGNLYGTTTDGGSRDSGTVYELSPAQSGWTETTLYSFNAFDTGIGSGGLIWDAHGNLFGIAGSGFLGEGPSAAYELTPQNGSWSFTSLYNFGEQSIGPISSPTFDSQGNLYGPLPAAGNGSGQIFRLTPSGNQWLYSPFYQFDSCSNGNACYPLGAVTFDANGNMYGTTETGGTDRWGTVWEITP